MKDGWRAIYCILKYNLHRSPWLIQFFFYIFIGGLAAIVNLVLFVALLGAEGLAAAALTAFSVAAAVNYYLSVTILFRRNARWKSTVELLLFLGVVVIVGIIDLYCTRYFVARGFDAWIAKAMATAMGLVLNFAGRRFVVFPEEPSPDWKPQLRK